jgi:hypothetical protein
MKKLEKAHERAIQEGWLIDYESLSVKEPFVNKRTFTSVREPLPSKEPLLTVPSSNTPPNSLKSRDLKDPSKKVFVNRYVRNTARKAFRKLPTNPKVHEKN